MMKEPDSATINAVRSRASRALTIPAGPFFMGGTDPDANVLDGEGPVREVNVSEFRIDRAPVTIAEFAAFTADTGYVTIAEETGWSYVFEGLLDPHTAQSAQRAAGTPWWCAIEGASWRAPEGPAHAAYETFESGAADLAGYVQSCQSVRAKLDHPVTHIALRDAEAFAQWCGMRLPSETEWEKAARGGLKRKRYPWGNTLMPDGRHMCNIFQGEFPTNNTKDDSFAGTSPVGAFPANGYGLVDVAGNVWEWTATEFSRNHELPSSGCKPSLAKPGTAALSTDSVTHANPCCTASKTVQQAAEAGKRSSSSQEKPRVIRGGSYLCHDSYCNRYRVAARTQAAPDSTSGNMGFRLTVS